MNTGADSVKDSLSGKRVLVVEDEGIVQMQIRRICSRAGLICAGAAKTGPEAVSLANELHPDIVLMDINMAGDFNGIEAARRIVESARTCVVMISAYVDRLEQAEAAGAAGYVVKPLFEPYLLYRLREIYNAFLSRDSAASIERN